MTHKELMKEKRKHLRAERKEIEAILHPSPIFDGVEIVHEHLRNGCLRFTAWEGKNPFTSSKDIGSKAGDIVLYSE